MIQVLRGHLYAIGVGAREVRIGTPLDIAIAQQGSGEPDARRLAQLVGAGWSPVMVYSGRTAPVPQPQWTPFVVLAARVGGDFKIQDYAGEVTPLSVFADPRWVKDLGPLT